MEFNSFADAQNYYVNQIAPDPEFKKLNYNAQLLVRKNIFLTAINKDPEFLNLSPENRAQALQNVIFQAPAMESSDMQQLVENTVADYKSGKSSTADTVWGAVEHATLGALPSLGTGIYNLVQALQGKSDQNYVPAEMYKSLAVNTFGNSSLLSQGSYTIASQMLKLIGKEGAVDEANSALRDVTKRAEYYSYLLNKDKRFSMSAQIAQGVGGFAGMAVDYALMYKMFAGTLQTPAGLAKPIFSGIDLLTNQIQSGALANWVGRAGKAISHAAIGGLINTTRETIMDSLKDMQTNDQFRLNLTNSALYFGQGFFGDLSFFAAGGFLKNLVGPMLKKGFIPALEDLKNVKHPAEIRAIQNAIQGVPIDEAVYGRLDPKQRSIIDHMQAYHKVMANVEVPDKIGMAKSLALSKNFLIDLDQTTNKWTLSRAFDQDDSFKPIQMDNLDDLTKKMVELVASPSPLAPQANRQAGSIATGIGATAELRQKITKTLGVDTVTADKLVNIVAPRGGEFTQAQLSAFVKGLNKGEQVIVIPKEHGFDIKIGERVAYSDFPKKVLNPTEEREALEKLTSVVGKENKIADDFITNYTKNLQQKKIFTPTWIESLVQDNPNYKGIIKTNNGYVLQQVNGEALTFDSFDKLGAHVIGSSTTQDVFARHLAYEGMHLKVPKKEGEPLQVWKGKNLVAYGKDIPTIIQDNPKLTPKLSSFYGPEIAAIDDTAEQITYQGKVLSGRVPDLLNQLAKFSDDPGRSAKIKIVGEEGNELSFNKLTKQYEIFIPEINHRQTFDDIGKARSFLKTGIKDYSTLYEIALQKGYRMVPYEGKWAIYTQGVKDNFQLASSVEELKKILKKVEMPEWANELTGMAKAELTNLKPLEGIVAKAPVIKFDRTIDIPLGWALDAWIRPPDAALNAAFKKGMPKELYDLYRKLEATQDIVKVQTSKILPAIEQAVSDPTTGKLIKDSSIRELFTDLLETPEAKWQEVAKSKGLDEKHLANIKALRTVYDELGSFAGIEKAKWLEQYAPHMRKNIDLNIEINDAEPGKFLKTIWGIGEPPRQILEKFKYSRTSEVAQFLMERDALVAARKYAVTAIRAKWLNPVLDEFQAAMKKNFGKLDNRLQRYIAGYLDTISGIPRHWGDKDLQEITQKLYTKLGFKDATGLSRDFTRYIMGLGYTSAMGFRPGLAIRNGFQLWQTLAPRLGNSWVMEGMEVIHKDLKGSFYDKLKMKNVIQPDMPIGGGEVFAGDDLVSKVVSSGMKWYQNIDEYTRAVAYASAEKCFNRAIAGMEKFKWDQDKFLMQSRLFQLDDAVQQDVLTLLQKGNREAAKDLFAKTFCDETMFKFGKSGQPELARRGFVGRLFGQMGQFSFYYLENVRRGLSRGGLAQRIGYASRWVGNSMALFGAFSALGIKADGFLPHQPILFGGGPFYNIVTDMLRSVGPGYEGAQARASLYGLKEKNGSAYWDYEAFLKSDLIRSITPFGVQAGYIDRAAKYMSEGDYYKGWLAATSFSPIQ